MMLGKHCLRLPNVYAFNTSERQVNRIKLNVEPIILTLIGFIGQIILSAGERERERNIYIAASNTLMQKNPITFYNKGSKRKAIRTHTIILNVRETMAKVVEPTKDKNL